MNTTKESGPQWVSAPCWHNCGGRCLVKVLVDNGKVIRTKTDDTHPDSMLCPQSRSCALSYKLHDQTFGPERIKHPMKRKNWSPDNPHGELRGKDEWERITWDEALQYVADGLTASREQYGANSVFYMNMDNAEGYLGQVIAASGGYTDVSGTQSTGTFGLRSQMYGFDVNCGNDRMDLANSDYIVLYGHNAAWCAFGNPSLYLKEAKEKGSKFVFVGPDYPQTAGFLNAEWIPVRPGTDTALLLGVAYSMISRDEDETLIDWDFIRRCTVGFDKDSMPADAKTDENFVQYVMGDYDDTPKDQKWASEICGTPVELIDRLADILGCKNDVSIHANGAPARNKGAENFPQLLMTVSAMGGHFGKPGNACANDQYYGAMNNGGAITNIPPLGSPAFFTNAGNPVDDVLHSDSMWDSIIEGKYWFAGNNLPYQPIHPVEERDIDIHVIVSDQHNFLSSQSNVNKGIEAFRKMDLVVSEAYYMKMDAIYSDIVLPIMTRWEHRVAHSYYAFKDKENAFATDMVCNPPEDVKSDYEIAFGLAEKLGLDYTALNPLSDDQRWFDQIAGTTVIFPDSLQEEESSVEEVVENEAVAFEVPDASMGTPLATIDQETIDKYGVAGQPQTGVIEFDEYLSKGVYRVPRKAGDDYTVIAYQDFRNDPEGHPLGTASGKMEIYCQTKSDFFDEVNGYTDGKDGVADFVKVSPLPKYLPQVTGYEDSFTDWERKVKGPYPIQLTHVHYLRRAHTDCDNITDLREAFVNPIYINKQDATERGISNGDVIRVFNENGQFLRPASVTRTVMPGVILVPHGARPRIDEKTGLDLSGSDNVLTSSNRSTTPFLNGWNTNLCQYEKYEGDIELLPDCEVAPIVPLSE